MGMIKLVLFGYVDGRLVLVVYDEVWKVIFVLFVVVMLCICIFFLIGLIFLWSYFLVCEVFFLVFLRDILGRGFMFVLW